MKFKPAKGGDEPSLAGWKPPFKVSPAKKAPNKNKGIKIKIGQIKSAATKTFSQ